MLGVATLLVVVSAVLYKWFESTQLQAQAKDTGLIIRLANSEAELAIESIDYQLRMLCQYESTSVPQLESDEIRECLENSGVIFKCARSHPRDYFRSEADWKVAQMQLTDGDPRATDLYATVFNGAILNELREVNYGACF